MIIKKATESIYNCMKYKKSGRGFTLIELLVVMSIISLLASVILTSVNSTRLKARNSQRVQAIKQLVNAFNLGLDAGGSFPSTTGLGYLGGGFICVSESCYGNWNVYTDEPAVNNFLGAFLSSKTIDPQDSSRIAGGYLYTSDAATQTGVDGYVFSAGPYLWFNTEGPSTANSCGPGHVFNINGNTVRCRVKLE